MGAPKRRWGLFDDVGAEALRSYKYVGQDLSLTYKYALSPLAEWVVQTFVPTWVAPNLITLLGLVFPLVSLGIFAWTAPSFQEEPPRWAFFFNAFALFAYQTLDNMDGKQARRTGMSNALGMVFDHGCDAINAGVGAINLLVVLGICSGGEKAWDPFLVVSALATPFVPFYVATWEEYYVGKLVLPIINGPAEGVLLGVAIAIISGVLGPAWWGQELASLPDWLPSKRPGDLVGLLSLAGVVFTCIMQITNVLYSQWREGRSVLTPLQDLLPFLALSLGTYALIHHQHQLLTESPLLTMGAVSAIFVEQVVSLMLAHMTHSDFVPHHRTLLPPFLLFVFLALYPGLASQTLFGGSAELSLALPWLWLVHFAVVVSYTVVYLLLIVADLARVLDVHPFKVSSSASAKLGAGNGNGNGASSSKVKRR